MTPALISACTGASIGRATLFAPYLTAAMIEFKINTLRRQAAFLAQIGHESGALRYTSELWGPTPAQRRYEGREDLGNTQPGDGSRYRGHGLIQTTGRFNHAATRDALAYLGAPDFEADPLALTQPMWAAMSAGWYWAAHGCNELADGNQFTRITRRINGGTNGLADRKRLWARARKAMESIA